MHYPGLYSPVQPFEENSVNSGRHFEVPLLRLGRDSTGPLQQIYKSNLGLFTKS